MPPTKKQLSAEEIIKRKEKKIKDMRYEIHEMDIKIHQTSQSLKNQKLEDKSSRIAKMRLKTHEADLIKDSKNRPSDMDLGIRIYTKMDLG